jgi:tRNA(Ile)-lysidine synthase
LNYLKVDFNFTQFEKLKKLVQSQVGTKIELGKKIIAHRERAKIVFAISTSENFSKTEIGINQKKKVFNRFLSVDQVNKLPKKFLRNSNVEYISGDNIKDKLLIRTWEIGDKIQLLGMKGTKKISDVLTDLKIPSYKRKNQLVLVYKKDVIWIVGNRISEKYKITPETKIKLKLCLK